MFRKPLMAAAGLAAVCATAALAQQPSYDRHFLDSTEYFIAGEDLTGGSQQVALAQMVEAPSARSRGEAQFLVIGGDASGRYEVGRQVWTRYYWRTRPATAPEASVGQRVFCLNKGVDGVYREPASRDEALSGGWFATTITDVSDVFRQEVRAGEDRLSLGCLRVNAAGSWAAMGPPPTPAAYDQHFLDSAEYFIATHEPSAPDEQVAVGRMVTAPTSTSRGEALFLVVGGDASGNYSAGQRVWTRYYWRTRPATTQEVRRGKVVFCLNAADDGVHRGPNDRSEALNGGWFRTTITDLSDLFRQQVRAGENRLGLGCLRVVQ